MVSQSRLQNKNKCNFICLKLPYARTNPPKKKCWLLIVHFFLLSLSGFEIAGLENSTDEVSNCQLQPSLHCWFHLGSNLARIIYTRSVRIRFEYINTNIASAILLLTSVSLLQKNNWSSSSIEYNSSGDRVASSYSGMDSSVTPSPSHTPTTPSFRYEINTDRFRV